MVCNERPVSLGVACAVCLDWIPNDDGLCPEQIVCDVANASGGWLIDRWGRAHRLAAHAIIGRQGDVQISSGSISRKHAVFETLNGAWKVIDLGSRNGTNLNDATVAGTADLEHGDRIQFGAVCFVFVSDLPFDPSGTPVDVGTQSLHGHLSDLGLGVTSATWLNEIRLLEPPRGGGGFVRFRGQTCELSWMQFAAVTILVERGLEETDSGEVLPGFVTSPELMNALPWETDTPEDTNLKHLIRRTRERLAPAGLAIEGRRGMGYRLALENN